jgi:membrane-associated protease RseP (regulator of RpoE activity)
MSHVPVAPPPFPYPPDPPAPGRWAMPSSPPPSRRLPLHLALLAMTAVTVLITGALWEGTFDDVPSLARVPLFILSHPASLASGIPFALSVLAILASHEMGHYLACRRYRIPATLPFFIPGVPPFGTFGAVIRIRGVIPDRRALFDVAAAGPLAGFAVSLPILVWGVLRATPLPAPPAAGGLVFGSPLLSTAIERLFFGGADLSVGSVYIAGWFGMLVTSMNLFPVGQLDGGHAVYALSGRVHRFLARATLLAVIALVVVQTILYRTLSAYTFWCVVLLLMRDRHPRLADELTPLDPVRRLGVALLLLIFIVSFIPVPLSL